MDSTKAYSLTEVYSLALGGITTGLILYRIISCIASCFSANFRSFWLGHLSYPNFYRRLSRVQPVSRSQLIIQCIYFSGTVVCNFIRVHSVAEAGSRAAKLSLINFIPLLLAGQHEFGAHLLGASLQTYIMIHRNLGVMTFLQASVHVVIALLKSDHSREGKSQLYGRLGAAMFLSLVMLPLFRKHLYELFLYTHLGFALFALFAIWRHTYHLEGTMPYIVTAAALFTITMVMQLARFLFRNVGRKSVRLSLVPRGNAVQVTLDIPRIWEIRAGERINLGVPRVGLFYWFQTHPFTITWWEEGPAGHPSSICLLFRARSGFTRKLLDRANPETKYRAWIDGPYGPSTFASWGKSGRVGDYGQVFMVATGIGIAAQIPYIKELLNGRRDSKVRTRKISLTWELDESDDWDAVREWLQSLVKQDNGYMLRVTLYDPSREPSTSDPVPIGVHDLISVYGGNVDWRSQLTAEMRGQVSTLLVTVSARRPVRDEVRQLVREKISKGVELFELEFQPWENRRSCWSYV